MREADSSCSGRFIALVMHLVGRSLHLRVRCGVNYLRAHAHYLDLLILEELDDLSNL